ncbi:hypothetical protein CAN33_008125 [Aspergillus niger]|uniref:CID domain-containing protein n=1 Tax=Aspergillus niger TaxID=5061 RepID=A0A505I7A6_ASPNG|nr:hypothetical protein CAN33_008125 [Aspergillus niger]
MMVDPFEVRMRFTAQLQHLNASVTSSQKAAHYALKYRDMDEDLHSCILEQLERNNMNNRANIMYFIEQFCDMATKEDHAPYVRMIQRDILRIVDCVAPADGSGAANVKHIEQRIEEDRERNKRLRESMWTVSGDDGDEHGKFWDEASDIGEDDFLAANEEVMERRQMIGAR